MSDQALRLTIPAPQPEEDAASVYSQIATKRDANELDAWFNDLVGETAPAAPGGDAAAAGVTPEAEADPLGLEVPGTVMSTPGEADTGVNKTPARAQGMVPGQGGDGWTLGDAAGAAATVLADVGKGLTEAPLQTVGGILGAVDEAAQFMEEIVPLGDVQIFNEAGELDLDWLSEEEAPGDAVFNALMPGEADSVTGGFVRSTAQFLTGFIPALKVAKGMKVGGVALGSMPALSEVGAGTLASMVVFDPHEDRLSTFLNEIPALEGIVPDYLADNNPANESTWEGRLKNGIEGLGLGAASDVLLRTFKYYKAQRQELAKAGAAADPVGAQAAAARDELKAASRNELVQDVPDEALAPLGDPNGPLVIEAKPNETLVQATGRLKAADERASLSIEQNDALAKIGAVQEKFTARAQAAGRDPMDEMLDELRSGAVSSAKLPKRPVAAIVGKLGGIDPASSLAGDMRSRGITAKSFPGLFRKGGLQAIDNVPMSEHPLFAERGLDDGAGYVTQQSFIDGLEAELKGQPWRLQEEQRLFDDVIGPIDELEEQLSRLGVEYENMSNESVKARLQAIRDEEDRFAAMADVPPNMGDAPLSERDAVITEMLDAIGADLPPKGTPLPELSAALKTRTAAMDELVSVLAADGGSVRLKHRPRGSAGDDGRSALVGPDMSEPGKFRITYFDERGPSGHTVHNTMEEAIDGALRSNYLPDDPRSAKAPAAPFDAGPEPIAGAGSKVYINHARINSADDVKAVLQQMADMDAEAIDAKRRGVVSNKQTIRESAREYQDLNDLIGRPPGPMTAAQAVAARRALVASGEQIVQLAKLAQSPNASKADLYNFRRAMSVHYALQSEVVAARTETARALQSWAIPAGATKARTQAIGDLITSSGGAGDLQALAKAVSTVADNPTGLNTMARELGRGRFGAAMYQVWINGLLSSPKTHAVNILSNSMVSLYAIPERYVAAAVSKAFYSGEVQTAEAAAQVFGLVKGIRDGARLAFLGNKADGIADLSDVFDAFVKTDQMHGNAISAEAFGMKAEGGFGYGIDMLGKIVNAPGSALAAEDKFFKAIGYRMELNSLAYRQAAAEGLEGEAFASRVADILNNPPEALKADAIDAAHYNTFTAPLGKAGQSMQLMLSRVPGARIVVPFVRTPTNIMKYTFARTPLAYLSGNIRADIAAGGARASQAHARVALGSMTMLTVMDLAAEGTITGAGPLDPKLKKVKQDSGWMPYSVKIGDRWYQYSRTDPIGMVMGLGADMAEIFANTEEEDAGMLATAGVVALASNLANKTYMSGIYDFIGAIDPSNPTTDPAKYLTNMAGGLVPFSSFLRNTAQAMDPTIREVRTTTYGEDGKPDPVASYLDGLVNSLKRGIPGQSDTLPPMRDLWGEDITRASGLGWGYDFISPIASRADDPDPVSQVILDNKIEVSSAPRIINGVRLTNEEYSEFVREAGRPAKEYLDKLIASPGFKRMSEGPDGMKAEVVKDVINNFRDRARQVMMQRNPQLRERAFLKDMEKRKMFTGQGE